MVVFARFSQLEKVVVIGDSIIRHCSSPHLNIHCFPGATVQSLQRKVIENFDGVIDFSTSFVIIHVGTNNLERSFWSKDVGAYFRLLCSVRERFRTATIVFSSILPRWDCEFLHEHSLIYNNNLEQFCLKNNCNFIETDEQFLFYFSLYRDDFLHLNLQGAEHLSSIFLHHLHQLIEQSFIKTNTSHWIPPELKKLWTPSPQKKKKEDPRKKERPRTVKSSRVPVHVRREKWTPNAVVVFPDGFRTPKRSWKPPPKPKLPPQRHVPEYANNLIIPYKVLSEKEQRHEPTCSVRLPSVRSAYVTRKGRKMIRKKKKKKKYHPVAVTELQVPHWTLYPGTPNHQKETTCNNEDRTPQSTELPGPAERVLTHNRSCQSSPFTTFLSRACSSISHHSLPVDTHDLACPHQDLASK
nr:uncharacterized protein LOC129267878 [Lytechinus pictus]